MIFQSQKIRCDRRLTLAIGLALLLNPIDCSAQAANLAALKARVGEVVAECPGFH